MPPERRTIRMDLNRVEGDMEVRLELAGDTVTDAWCVGTMFRGFEQILVGRDPEDALVIAPRICGICSTSQLYAATSALETAYGSPIAPNGTRIRNLCLMAESVMSDARHTFLMFAPDFCNEAYRDHPLYPRAVELFEPPFKGRLAAETVENTKRILAIVIAFGGQWPHSTYMMPGGVTCALDESKLAECSAAIDSYAEWYERAVLGCTLDEWATLETAEDFDAWLEAPAHRDGAAGVFTQFGRAIGLEELGRGTPHLLGMGCYYEPERWQPPFRERPCLQEGGFYDGVSGTIEPFRQEAVSEHLRFSRFADPGSPRHPWDSGTVPDDESDEAYSYAKATRYADHVVQLGPLADLVLAGDPLITSMLRAQGGAGTWLRQFTRLHRPVATLQAMRETVSELRAHLGEPTSVRSEPEPDGDGFGAINAARGSLGHWVRIRDGEIANYQVITPTAWNGSPRDAEGRRGHWEESFVGLEIQDLENPVELFHIVRSHDACLVCTVHLAATRGASKAFTFW